MWGLAALMLLVAGCDKLFDITYVKDTTDGGSDAHRVDASPGVPCSNPVAITSQGTALAVGFDQITIAEDRSFALGVAASRVFAIAPLEPTAGPPAVIANIPGIVWANPAMTPDGMHVYLANTADTAVYESGRMGDVTAWSGPTKRTDIATTALPGGLAELPGGQRRLVVIEGAKSVREYAWDGVSWTMGAMTSGITELTTMSSGIVASPSMTPDGLILVFTVSGSGSGGDGVWYVKRSSTALSNNFNASAPGASWGQLLSSTHTLASPYLADDCSLFVLSDRSLYHYPP